MVISASSVHYNTDHHFNRGDEFPYWAVSYRVSGMVTVRSQSQSITSGPRHITVIPPHTPYSLSWGGVDPTDGSSDWEIYWCIFSPPHHWMPLLNLPETAPGVFGVDIAEGEINDLIFQWFKDAAYVFRNNISHASEMAENALHNVFFLLNDQQTQPYAETLDPRIDQVKTLIDTHIHQTLTIKSLAESVNLSPSRFNGLFKAQLGVPPMQYIESRRLQRAAELLLSTSKRIQDIADELGYENQFYFSTRFKKHVGMSPQNYRKQPLLNQR